MKPHLALLAFLAISSAPAQIVVKASGDDAIKITPKSVDIDATISGPLVTSTWTYVFATHDSWSKGQADFLIKIPKGGVVHGFAYWYQGEKVIARVAEKERAAEIYRAIVRRQRDPALIEMVGPDTFRVRVFPIEAQADLKVELQMTEVLPVSDRGRQWQVNWAKYGKLQSAHLKVQPDASMWGDVRADASPGEYRAENQRPRDLKMTLPWSQARDLQTSVYSAKSGGNQGYFVATFFTGKSNRVPDARWGPGVSQVRAVMGGPGWRTYTGRYSGEAANPAVAGYRPRIGFSQLSKPNNPATKVWAWSQINAGLSRKAIVDLSTRYTIPSKYTSWIAIPAAERERMRKEIAQADYRVWLRPQLAAFVKAGPESPRGRAMMRRFQTEAASRGVEVNWYFEFSTFVSEASEKWEAAVLNPGYGSTAERAARARYTQYLVLTQDATTARDRDASLTADAFSITIQKVYENRKSGVQTARARQLERQLKDLGRLADLDPNLYIQGISLNDAQVAAWNLLNEENAGHARTPKMASLRKELDRIHAIGGPLPQTIIADTRAVINQQRLHTVDYELANLMRASTLDEAKLKTLGAERQTLIGSLRAAGKRADDYYFDQEIKRTYAPLAEEVANGRDASETPPLPEQYARAFKLMGITPESFWHEVLSEKYDQVAYARKGADLQARRDWDAVRKYDRQLANLKRYVPNGRPWQTQEVVRGENAGEERNAFLNALRTGPATREEKPFRAAMSRGYIGSRTEYADTRISLLRALNDLDQLDQQQPDPDVLAQKQELERRATELRARLGDPIVGIEAPDATGVIAQMPDGSWLRLYRVGQSGRWEGRFDVPPGVPDGRYAIRVRTMGPVPRETVVYINVDQTSPTVTWTYANGVLRATANEPLARVVAIAGGERIELTPVGDGTFTARCENPTQVIATDMAHNRSDQVHLTVSGAGKWASYAGYGIGVPLNAPNWPRQSVTWWNRTVTRNTFGQVMVDGQPLRLPRGEATAIAVAGDALYVAQMGGYTRFTDSGAENVFPSALAGVPTSAIAVNGSQVLLGTQGRGLAIFTQGEVTYVDERNGLKDDWITSIQVQNNHLRIGTFVGGAYERANGAWMPIAGTEGAMVAGFADDYIATRQGVFQNGQRVWDGEATCIGFRDGEVWVGTRDGDRRLLDLILPTRPGIPATPIGSHPPR